MLIRRASCVSGAEARACMRTLTLWWCSSGTSARDVCTSLFGEDAGRSDAFARWRQLESPRDGEVLRVPPGQLFEVTLRGDPAVKRRGAAAVLLLDGALVAYGGGWEEEDTLQLPAQPSGSHTLTLGVVSDTGGDTWKRESDLCTVQSLSFVVEDEAERGQPQPPSGGALGAITWPRNGARLLASEVHLLRFELEAPAVVSLGCNGVKRREALPYEAGPHETTLDFLADCTAGAAGGDAAVEMLLWDDAESGGGGGGVQDAEEAEMRESLRVNVKLVLRAPAE